MKKRMGYLVATMLPMLMLMGCGGKNSVVVTVDSAPGTRFRIDASELALDMNLVSDGMGQFEFSDIDAGEYSVRVVVTGQILEETIKIDSPPMSGETVYPLNFVLPRIDVSESISSLKIVCDSSGVTASKQSLMQVPAGEKEHLAGEGVKQQDPDWLPGGEAVFYACGDMRSNMDICKQSLDDGSEETLTDFAKAGEYPAVDFKPSVSPDSTTVAFASNRDVSGLSNDYRIWLMNLDGENQRLLPIEGGKFTGATQPAWTPDGQRLVFVGNDARAGKSGKTQIYIVDKDGKNLRQLTDDAGGNNSPAVFPSGDHIVYATSRFGDQEIMLMTIDGTAHIRITVSPHTFEVDPVPSPDGQWIILSAGREYVARTKTKGSKEGTYGLFGIGWEGFNKKIYYTGKGEEPTPYEPEMVPIVSSPTINIRNPSILKEN